MEAKGEISMRMVHCGTAESGMTTMWMASAPGAGPSTSLSGSGAAGPPRPLSPLRHSRSGQEAPAGTGRKSPSGRDGHGPAAEGAVPRSTAAGGDL